MSAHCDFCDEATPPGCHGLNRDDKSCALHGHEDSLAAKVGRAVISDLTDRRGLRQAFDNIDAEIQAECMTSFGESALSAIKAAGFSLVRQQDTNDA